MRALLYPDFDQLEFRSDIPEPTVGTGEVLVEVKACGICGSEMGGFASRSPRRRPPIVMGHEFAGVIQEIGPRSGPEADALRVGQRVMVNAVVHCGECDLCRRELTHLCRNRQVFGMNRPGAFAERVNVPSRVVYPLPDNVSFVQGALVEPLGNGVHVVDLARGNTLETVLVCGAGTIGLMCFLAARAAGARRIALSDTNSHRLEVARNLGADLTINVQEQDLLQTVLDWTDGRGLELAVDAVGVPSARRDVIQAIRPGGDAVWIGLHSDEISISSFGVVLPEKRVIGSYAAADRDIRRAIQLLSEGRVPTESWTEIFPLEAGADVFLDMLHQRRPTIKAVLQP
jgi:threonine dehydrogenase-like Zn-dependent dehydrogenase